LGFKGICKGGNKNQQLHVFFFTLLPEKLSPKWLKKRFDSYQFAKGGNGLFRSPLYRLNTGNIRL